MNLTLNLKRTEKAGHVATLPGSCFINLKKSLVLTAGENNWIQVRTISGLSKMTSLASISAKLYRQTVQRDTLKYFSSRSANSKYFLCIMLCSGLCVLCFSCEL